MPLGSLAEFISLPMSIGPNFLRSVLLTSLFSFVVPTLLIGGGWTSFCLISYLPFLKGIGQSGADLIWQFLATFGSGHPLQGFLVIGITFSLVGALFDAYAYHQTPRGG
ncbi:MAG: hypothetical protein ACM37W_20450 [Actinomycetota bacterium]